MTRLARRLGDFYDDYRTALLAKKYYCHRLAVVKRLNLCCDVVLAVAASSTFASTQVFQQYPLFRTIAPWAAGAVALLAVVKPLFGFEKEVERLSRLVAHYADLFEQMRRLVTDISIERAVSDAQEWQAQSMQTTMIKLSSYEDLNPRRRRLARLQADVHQEIPSNLFWYPDAAAEAEAEESPAPTPLCKTVGPASATRNLVPVAAQA